MCFFVSAKAQNRAADAFLKAFPDLRVGSVVGEAECKKAMSARVPREAIAGIDYKALIYSSANDISKWDIMPLGKFKIKEGVYFVLYFSAIMGANHTNTDYSYVLCSEVFDFNKNEKTGQNYGNNGEFSGMGDKRKQDLIQLLGKDADMTLKANFSFKITSQNGGTLTSYWLYNPQKERNETYNFSWDTDGSLKIY
ncbi:MAG: hypothetical protein EAZ57_02215 [Cytophagales bacterium]|nr:MAG: hypothetical protein EAZ67_02370 [Cytophagales bacterium]TAF61933.1 MAG: hypothetical protein EAZ57_02215 [Cytophagales bacterium]